MRGHHGDRRRHFHPGLFLLGALWLSAPEHASGQPLWLERVQSPDGVRDNSLTMKNILPELRAERGWTQGELATRLKVGACSRPYSTILVIESCNSTCPIRTRLHIDGANDAAAIYVEDDCQIQKACPGRDVRSHRRPTSRSARSP